MAENHDVEHAAIRAATQELQRELRAAAERSEDAAIQALARETSEVTLSAGTENAAPPTVVVVGQRGAGKSTLLRALTGRADIAVGSNFGTSAVAAYDWNGVRLVDTPGLHAGSSLRDAYTHAAIERADVVLFVITSELFDESVAHHFRELAFQRQYARRMVLVVNKMGLDPSLPETLRPDIDRVTAPLSAADFRTVFLDARAGLDALQLSGADRDDLTRVANLAALRDMLDRCLAERRSAGALSTTLSTLRGIAERAAGRVSKDSARARCALELLSRKRGLFVTSRARVRALLNGVVARAVADIGRCGDEVAETIEVGQTFKAVEARHSAAQTQAQKRSAALTEEARRVVVAELADLRRQLGALRESLLAAELREQLDAPAWDWSRSLEISALADPAQAQSEPPASEATKSANVRDVVNQLGDFAARWATGPIEEVSRASGAAAARAGDAPKANYNVGKFLGAPFQPWSAPKVARAIGNAGRAIAGVSSVLAVVAHIAEERQQERSRTQLRDARVGVRAAYRDATLAVQAACAEQFEALLRDFYDSELSALDEKLQVLSPKRSERSAALLRTFQALAQRASKLIDRAQAASVG
jgi:small GTP-binding protein